MERGFVRSAVFRPARILGFRAERKGVRPTTSGLGEGLKPLGEATKAPDYCFRIGGTRKFFLEAKRPSVDIKHDVTLAFSFALLAAFRKVSY